MWLNTPPTVPGGSGSVSPGGNSGGADCANCRSTAVGGSGMMLGLEPSPQLIVTTCASSSPGSKNTPVTLTAKPPVTMLAHGSITGTLAESAERVGATLLTVI